MLDCYRLAGDSHRTSVHSLLHINLIYRSSEDNIQEFMTYITEPFDLIREIAQLYSDRFLFNLRRG